MAAYVWIGGIACAFAAPGSCDIALPWTLRGDELVALVVLPASLVLGLVGAGFFTARRPS
ncbi:MAG: methionine synthase [Nannocystaceae bacterium]|nr:methionine synthase [bacterium]